jgi:hypothetical protein
MKIYQINNNHKKYFDLDIKAKNIKELVKEINKNKNKFIYDNILNCYGIYIEKIPKEISKNENLTIVIEKNEIRYFSSLY